jgi:hypothetical protein
LSESAQDCKADNSSSSGIGPPNPWIGSSGPCIGRVVVGTVADVAELVDVVVDAAVVADIDAVDVCLVVVGEVTFAVLDVLRVVVVIVDAVLVEVVEVLVVVVFDVVVLVLAVADPVVVDGSVSASLGIFNLKSFLPGHFSKLIIKLLMEPSA